jgi:acyl-CoA synthetase
MHPLAAALRAFSSFTLLFASFELVFNQAQSLYHLQSTTKEKRCLMIRDIKINEGQKALYYQKGYWTDETLADVWQHRAAQHASKEYVCDNKGSRYTYGEIDEKASRLANWLIVQGIRAGDVVTMQFPTWAEFCIAYVAVLKVGGVMHPVPRDYTDADLEYVMNLVGSSAYLAPTSSHATS